MADATTPGCDATPLAGDLPHLDDGVVSEFAHRLPTRDAYRLAGVCPPWRAVLSEPTFLCRHLSPRPLPLLDGRPHALILQPRSKTGFTHLTVVATDPADRVPVNIPVSPKYMDPPAVRALMIPSKPPRPPRSPRPALLDTATDNSVLRLLEPSDDPDNALEATDADDESAEDDAPAPDLFADEAVVPSDEVATEMDVSAPADPAPPQLDAQVDDYVAFFERTVPMLDISIVASHGRLLLGRSRTRFYVCDPAANRWLPLPPPKFAPDHYTNTGLHYDDLDASTGRLAFAVVLLVRARHRRVLVETFSSTTGRWEARELPAHGVARCLGARSPGPGIHAGSCFYWLSPRKALIVRYDAARGHVSVLREPAEAEQSKGRVGRSLGSVGGRLRMCAFDIRDESQSMLPHDGLQGVHGVWVMDGPAASPWRRAHEAVVDDISAWYFLSLFNNETPLDFAGASGDFIVVDKQRFLLRYDLESGSKVQLASLYRNTSQLGALYRRYHVFPFFR